MADTLHLVSWNVNGLRAVLKKDALEPAIQQIDPDIVCLQETKISADTPLPELLPGLPERVIHCADKRGYSGTAVFSRPRPASTACDWPAPWADEHPREGRIILAEYEKFQLVNLYVPNSQRGLLRLPYRQGLWDVHLAEYLRRLGQRKPLVVTGDFNVAHKEIDLANPKANVKNAGFTPEERAGFTHLLEHAGLVDSYRHLYPDREGAYTWWTYRSNARERNIGWRIDYFLVSRELAPQIVAADIYPELAGSDHCPIGLRLTV